MQPPFLSYIASCIFVEKHKFGISLALFKFTYRHYSNINKISGSGWDVKTVVPYLRSNIEFSSVLTHIYSIFCKLHTDTHTHTHKILMHTHTDTHTGKQLFARTMLFKAKCCFLIILAQLECNKEALVASGCYTCPKRGTVIFIEAK